MAFFFKSFCYPVMSLDETNRERDWPINTPPLVMAQSFRFCAKTAFQTVTVVHAEIDGRIILKYT
jgi:hypothetical protein